MSDESLMKSLTDAEAIITNSHIVYTSGRHGSDYFNKDALYVNPKLMNALTYRMAKPFQGKSIDVVAGPTIGGVILSQWVAWHLSPRTKSFTAAVFAEEEVADNEKIRIFKRGYDAYIPNKNVLIVEDVLNTGGSIKKVVEAVTALGGNIVGATVICNRGGVTAQEIGVERLFELVSVSMESWPEESCPLCEKNIPIETSVGKGAAFLTRKGITN